MRIGILTFHHAHNYGAVLQCYALKRYLLSQGAEVEVIDYRSPAIIASYKRTNFLPFGSLPLRQWLGRMRFECSILSTRMRRFDAFEAFIQKELRPQPVSNIMEHPYDLILVGSDQVWNYHLTQGFDSHYWGEFTRPATTRLATYAVSMHDHWPEEMNQEIAKRLQYFDAISVRENLLQEQLQPLCPKKEISVVVDPTLLIGATEWDKIAIAPRQSKRPYLLLYQVLTNPKAEAVAEKVAAQLGLEVVYLCVGPTGRNSRSVRFTSPEEFIGLFKHADFVVSASFHGTVFALQYGKPFYSIRSGKGVDNRVESLLAPLKLSHRFISSSDEVDSPDISYSNKQFNVIIEQSKKYIHQLLHA